MAKKKEVAKPEFQISTGVGLAILAVAALAVYLPSVFGGPILDDDALVTENLLIRDAAGLYRIWFTTEAPDYWPVTSSTFWLEWHLWGAAPLGYHLVNLALHVAAGFLIWKILARLAIPGAFLAALLFTVHPVNVESIAWISQRKNSLSMVFYLLSILAYLRAEEGSPRRYWLLSLAAFVLAMLSKGSVVVLPAVLVLIAWWRSRLTVREWARIAPFFVVGAALAVVNVWFQKHGSGVVIRDVTPLGRLLGAAAAVWFYLGKALAPVGLLFVYPQWRIDAGDWRWWIPLLAAVLATVLLVVYRARWWGRPTLFAWLYFVFALAPALGFVDVGYMKHSLVADHYQHLAIIGVVALVATGVATLAASRQPIASLPARETAIALSSASVLALVYLANLQSALYGDAVALYEAALAGNSESSLLENNLGAALLERGEPAEAVPHLQHAAQLDEHNVDAHYNAGNSFVALGKTDEAIASYQRALAIDPHSVQNHNNLALVLSGIGRTEEAAEHFRAAIESRPNFADAHFNYGNLLTAMNRHAEAAEQYRAAVAGDPALLEAALNLAVSYARQEKWDESIAAAESAMKLATSQDRADVIEKLNVLLPHARAKREGKGTEGGG